MSKRGCVTLKIAFEGSDIINNTWLYDTSAASSESFHGKSAGTTSADADGSVGGGSAPGGGTATAPLLLL